MYQTADLGGINFMLKADLPQKCPCSGSSGSMHTAASKKPTVSSANAAAPTTSRPAKKYVVTVRVKNKMAVRACKRFKLIQ